MRTFKYTLVLILSIFILNSCQKDDSVYSSPDAVGDATYADATLETRSISTTCGYISRLQSCAPRYAIAPLNNAVDGYTSDMAEPEYTPYYLTKSNYCDCLIKRYKSELSTTYATYPNYSSILNTAVNLSVRQNTNYNCYNTPDPRKVFDRIIANINSADVKRHIKANYIRLILGLTHN